MYFIVLVSLFILFYRMKNSARFPFSVVADGRNIFGAVVKSLSSFFFLAIFCVFVFVPSVLFVSFVLSVQTKTGIDDSRKKNIVNLDIRSNAIEVR